MPYLAIETTFLGATAHRGPRIAARVAGGIPQRARVEIPYPHEVPAGLPAHLVAVRALVRRLRAEDVAVPYDPAAWLLWDHASGYVWLITAEDGQLPTSRAWTLAEAGEPVEVTYE